MSQLGNEANNQRTKGKEVDYAGKKKGFEKRIKRTIGG